MVAFITSFVFYPCSSGWSFHFTDSFPNSLLLLTLNPMAYPKSKPKPKPKPKP